MIDTIVLGDVGWLVINRNTYEFSSSYPRRQWAEQWGGWTWISLRLGTSSPPSSPSLSTLGSSSTTARTPGLPLSSPSMLSRPQSYSPKCPCPLSLESCLFISISELFCLRSSSSLLPCYLPLCIFSCLESAPRILAIQVFTLIPSKYSFYASCSHSLNFFNGFPSCFSCFDLYTNPIGMATVLGRPSARTGWSQVHSSS